MDKLRFLNFDDLYILQYLLRGYSLTNIARALKLTQPAVTQRMRKIENVFGCPIFQRVGRDISLTNEGRAICKKASDILALMSDLSPSGADTVVNVGTRPEAGRSWLWPAITKLRVADATSTFHLHFGSGSEILGQLGTGKLDAVLTSAPVTTQAFKAIELDEERYVAVATPAIANEIKTFADLEKFILIEHDRSFPFLRYVPAAIRTQLRYKDVWFLESTEIMAQALVDGLGVGIIPEYIANRFDRKKELKTLKLDFKLEADHFRMIYRADRDIEKPVTALARELKRIGLQ